MLLKLGANLMVQTYKRYLLAFIAISLMIITIETPSISAEQIEPPSLFEINDDQQSKEFYINLDGEWIFFEQALLTPQEVKGQLRNGMGRAVSLPSSFKTQTGEINSFGTYSTTIKIPEEYVGETLAIHIPFQYSAYTLYIDQTDVIQNGVMGQESASHTAEMAPRTGYFIAQSDEVLLTMQVSSFDHIRGDLRTPFI